MTIEKPLMPRKLPSQKRAKITVDTILEAAAQVFTELGYAACTTNKIAERAGVSIGSLYQYFPNKDAIIVSLTEKMFRDGLDIMEGLVEDMDDMQITHRQIPRRFIEGMVAVHMKNPKLHKLLVNHAPDLRSISKKAWDSEKEFSNILVKMLGKEPNLRVKNLSLAAPFIVLLTDAVCHWLIQLSSQNLEDDKNPESHKKRQIVVTQIIDEMEDVLLRYLFI